MKSALYSHSDCDLHAAAARHPEAPERLTAIADALSDPRFDSLIRKEAPLADRMDLQLAHTNRLIGTILDNAPAEGAYVRLDADTVMSFATPRAALRAAGAACAAVDGVMAGAFQSAFCAMRPPGHHAEPDRAMGFCFFSNIAIAALQARQHHGLDRIAVVDFDVHHGNGTQEVLRRTEGMYFASIHQHPHYPGTGTGTENITGGPCRIRNIPLAGGTSAKAWRQSFAQTILEDLDQFEPELILVSAGFDAHRDDPLGAFNLVEDDYHWLGEQLSGVAKAHASSRLVSALEGGYNLEVLGTSVAAYIEAIMAG